MKLRTSFFNATIFKKDITRFAPLWAIYFVGGLLVMMTALDNHKAVSSAHNLAATAGPFAIINLIYAVLVVQVLFGDLYNSRLCNALHALPMRRECWFLSKVAAGLCYSVVPHLVAVVFFFLHLQEYWFIGLLWALVMLLEYLFFFGLATFAAFCTGNRLASIAIYLIINFTSVIAYWFVSTIYEPLMYGVTINDEPFLLLCPVVEMVSSGELIHFDGGDMFSSQLWNYNYLGLGDGWDYLLICAFLGIGLLAASLLLYRRRNLECAGDFVAVRPVAPIFSVVFTLCVGCMFALFGELFGTGSFLFALIVGLILGWFTGQMLLNRTVKVFNGKTFLGFGLLASILLVSVVLFYTDAFGIVRYVPDPEKVTMVEISTSTQLLPGHSDYVKLEDPAQIEKMTLAHREMLDKRNLPQAGNRRYLFFRYTTESGNTVTRYAYVHTDMDAWDFFDSLYNTPDSILGSPTWDLFHENVYDVYLGGWALADRVEMYNDKHNANLDFADVRRELLQALWKDCEEGHMGTNFTEAAYSNYYLELATKSYGEYGYYGNLFLSIRIDAKHTLAWFQTYKDLLPEEAYK